MPRPHRHRYTQEEYDSAEKWMLDLEIENSKLSSAIGVMTKEEKEYAGDRIATNLSTIEWCRSKMADVKRVLHHRAIAASVLAKAGIST
jgi:hypothetical protein